MGKPSEMHWHPAACIFPMLSDELLNELADDIEKHGQHEPIVLLDGKVLDGRNRWVACKMRGIEPKTAVHKTPVEDPVAYVVSLNIHRRHLTPSQASMCAARARDIYEKQAKERQQVRKGEQPGASVENLPQLEPSKARDAAGKAFGVSGKSVDHAKRVLEKGIPELAKAVDEARMAVSTAAILATEPEDVQRAEVENPKRNRTYKPTASGGSLPVDEEPVVEKPIGEVQGVGVQRAHDAIACLKKIPRNDALRMRAFQIVSDYIKHNQRR